TGQGSPAATTGTCSGRCSFVQTSPVVAPALDAATATTATASASPLLTPERMTDAAIIPPLVETVTAQDCPKCGTTVPVHHGYVTWCHECGWNLTAPQPDEGHTRFDRLYAAAG